MNHGRRGGIIVRLLAMMVVVAVAGSLCWGALNHQRVTGTWSFHPLDPSWWSPTSADGKTVPASDVVDDARVIGDQVGQALWGKGGLIERVEKWWDEHETHGQSANQTAPGKNTDLSSVQSSPQQTDNNGQIVNNKTAPPLMAPDTSLRGLLEQRLQHADGSFQAGLAELKTASPVAGDATLSTVERLTRVAAARERFISVEHDLAETIPAYEAIPQHDAQTVATAKQLRAFNKQMLEMTGGVP